MVMLQLGNKDQLQTNVSNVPLSINQSRVWTMDFGARCHLDETVF